MSALFGLNPHLYLVFNKRTINARIKVTMLVMITGNDFMENP
jgi:hypothetical protein